MVGDLVQISNYKAMKPTSQKRYSKMVKVIMKFSEDGSREQKDGAC